MAKLDVKRQKHMKFKWLLDICLNSMVHRLMRSVVTVVIITLAIAFLTFIMVDSYIGSSVRDTVLKRVDRITLGTRFFQEISKVPSAYSLVGKVCEAKPDGAYYRNIQAWGKLDEKSMAEFHKNCCDIQRYLTFFAEIPVGRRVILVENNTDLEIFAWLGKPENFKQYKERLSQMPSVKMPTSLDEFQTFIKQWPSLKKELTSVRAGYRETLKKIDAFSKNKSFTSLLVNCQNAKEQRQLFEELKRMGFAVDSSVEPLIIKDVSYQNNLVKAMNLLKNREIRTGWFRKFQEKFVPAEALKKCAVSSGHLNWVYASLGKDSGAAPLSKENFKQVAARYRKQQEILASKLELVQKYGKTGSLNPRAIWLIIVSFMVCAVGIANAMLMTVLERFKEIATMKCLGARNETIGVMFMMESVMIGVIGGLVGILLGFVIDFVRQLIFYGSLVFDEFPFSSVALTFAVSFACSLLLALIAAIYPAIVASRMAPMEAMRVD